MKFTWVLSESIYMYWKVKRVAYGKANKMITQRVNTYLCEYFNLHLISYWTEFFSQKVSDHDDHSVGWMRRNWWKTWNISNFDL